MVVYSDDTAVMPFVAFNQCKLYDYEGRRWLDFDGMPTTPAATLHRALGRAAMQEAAPSVT